MATLYSCSCESVRRGGGLTTVQTPPLIEYSALPRVLRASFARKLKSIFPAAGAARRSRISGGVLSIRKGSLSSWAESDWSGGFDGASVAVIRTTYLPSGYAVAS